MPSLIVRDSVCPHRNRDLIFALDVSFSHFWTVFPRIDKGYPRVIIVLFCNNAQQLPRIHFLQLTEERLLDAAGGEV